MQRQRIKLVKFRADVLQRVSIFGKHDGRFIDPPQKPPQRMHLALAPGGDGRECRQAFEPHALLVSVPQACHDKLEPGFVIGICPGEGKGELFLCADSGIEEKRDATLDRTCE